MYQIVKYLSVLYSINDFNEINELFSIKQILVFQLLCRLPTFPTFSTFLDILRISLNSFLSFQFAPSRTKVTKITNLYALRTMDNRRMKKLPHLLRADRTAERETLFCNALFPPSLYHIWGNSSISPSKYTLGTVESAC